MALLGVTSNKAELCEALQVFCSTGLFLGVGTSTWPMGQHRYYQAEFSTLSQGVIWAGLMGNYNTGLRFELCRAKWDPFSTKSNKIKSSL